jgi:subtilase family serine protease
MTVVSSAALALSFAGAAAAAPAAPAAPQVRAAAAASSTTPDYKRACAAATRPAVASCLVLMRTNVAQRAQASLAPDAAPSGVGYGPSSLQSAYALSSATAGSGQTVAVVDAFDDPNAASDLATYRADWGLPACGSGCFEKVNQNGQTSPLPAAAGSSGWDVEASLDIDMVSAICPNCHIVLVETNSADLTDLGAGVNAAVSLGAKYVSNSYGGSESSTDLTYDSEFYNHPGVAVTASAGDSGYGVSYPAASQYVTAVGGTALNQASNSRGWTESVWSTSSTEGTGAGCSADDPKPSWQTDTGCARRTDNDIAAVADPNTGVATYDTYSQGGWLEVGGTSASSPIIASVFALAGTPAAGTYPSSYIYQHTSSLFDVTSGSLGSCSPAYLCTAEVGYDGPTGWGTPDGTAAFTSAPVTGQTITLKFTGKETLSGFTTSFLDDDNALNVS